MKVSTKAIANVILVTIIFAVTGYFVFTMAVFETHGRENRAFQPFPDLLKADRVNRRFGVEFDAYLSDHLKNRDTLIDWHGKLTSVGDRRGNRLVLIGRDGWLFIKTNVGNEYNFSQMAYYQNKVGFSGEQLKKIKSDLQAVQKWCDERNIAFYIMIPPDKQTVYQEFYPSFIKRTDHITLARFMEAYLRRDFNVVPLEEMFLKFKEYDYLHYKTESHWTYAGAYLAYKILLNHIATDFEDVKPIDEKQVIVTPTAEVVSAVYPNGKRKIYKGNLYEWAGKPSFLPIHEQIYKKYTLPHQDEIQVTFNVPVESSYNPYGLPKKIYILGDSYADYLFPFMAATFNVVEKVRLNQGKRGLRFNERKKDIQRANPDILILSLSDMKLINLLKILN